MSEKDDNEFRPEYQRGRTSVEHRNIDAAGESHPFGEEPQSFEADLRHLIRKVADDLYQSWEATIREYLANAETATLKVEEYLENPEDFSFDLTVDDGYEPKIEVTWDKQEGKVIIKDNGIGMAAVEVDEIFRQIGHSAARDDGTKSGQFGMGALSFVKLVGLDNAMIMTSHSRINDDNASYYVTLAGVEPIRGQLASDEYGTKFQMTPDGDYRVRRAVEKYAEWMRVPVIYREIGTDGTEVFNEDWGDKRLYDAYDNDRICLGVEEEDAFKAYCSPEAQSKTLLLSMEIGRNDGRHSPRQHGAPFSFDVRLLDESGKVIRSSNGNEGLMPCPRSDYKEMLVEARDPYIAEDLLNNGDVIGQEVENGPNEGSIVVSDEVLASNEPLPPKNYITKGDLSDEDEPGQTEVLIGPNQGRTVVDRDEWEEMDAGRAELYVPEDELEEYDVETGEGDLCLPEPTSDRDRLKEHAKFWSFIGERFAEQFDGKVDEVYELIDGADDPLETIMQMEPEDLSLALKGIGKLPSGRRRSLGIPEAVAEKYGSNLSEKNASLLDQLRRSVDATQLVNAIDHAGLKDADDFDEMLSKLDSKISDGMAERGDGDAAAASKATKKSNRPSAYVAELVNEAHPNGTVYMVKSTGGAFQKKAQIAWDLHDDNQVVVVDEYDEWEDLLGWERLTQFPHGKNKIREEYGSVLSDDVLDRIAAKKPDSGSSDKSSSSSSKRKRRDAKDEILNVARGSRHRERSKIKAEDIRETFEDDETLGRYSPVTMLVLFPTTTDRNMTEHWWIAGEVPGGNIAIANCNKKTYEYLSDLDEVWHVEDYIEQASDYEFDSTEGLTTLPEDDASNYVLHIVTEETKNRLMRKPVFETMPSVLGPYMDDKLHRSPDLPDEEDMVYCPLTAEDAQWLRPMLINVGSGEEDPTLLTGSVSVRDIGRTWNCSSDYKLYSRARLSDWDFEWEELELLDKMSYRLDLDQGGFEFIETLGKLHDAGEKPFSETPQARWS